jgi:hypothetical protein
MSMLLAALAFAATRPETITYQTSPCFGSCPVYKVTVSADGRGTFEGQRFTAATGTKSFRVTPRRYAAFRRQLDAARPAGELLLTPDNKACGMAPTDMPGIDVRWAGGGRKPSHLSFYTGCNSVRAQGMKRSLRAAPEALPIAAFIGERSLFQGRR